MKLVRYALWIKENKVPRPYPLTARLGFEINNDDIVLRSYSYLFYDLKNANKESPLLFKQ